jgi:hypothetical protein
MSTPLVIRLPLDWTGQSTDNLVVDEPHALTANRTYRAIAPLQGAFFQASLKVYDNATGALLTDGTNGTVEQYYACEYYELPSEYCGKEIDAIIIVKDPSVSNDVRITYQALGGAYGTSVQAIIQQIENLGLDDRPVAWGDIIGKPAEFPPSKHLHDAGDVYGFEYLVHACDRIRDAIEIGDQASHDAIYRYIDAAIAALQNYADNIQQQLSAHLEDFNNPHRVTADQLNVYTKPQADAITTPIANNLAAHVGNKNNPHAVTVDQLNTYDGPTIDSKIQAGIDSVKLGFTPVQQGGGAGQGTNKIYLGWDNTGLRLQVDNVDKGQLTLLSTHNADVAAINNALAGKAPNVSDYAYTGRNQNVWFYNMTANGTVYSGNDVWAFASDERLKTDIQDLRDPLGMLQKIRGVYYRFNDLAEFWGGFDTKRQHVGVLANEVKEVLPEIVGPAPFDIDHENGGKSRSGEDFVTVQYEKFTPLLIEGVKKLDCRTEDLLSRLERAEELLEKLTGG